MSDERAPREHEAAEQARVLPFRPRRRASPSFGEEGLVAALRRRAGVAEGDPRRSVRRLRRHPLLRFARPFALALLIVGAPVAVMGWFFHSPLLALTELDVEVVAGGRVDELWVRRTLRPFLGQNLPRLPLTWIDHELDRHPWVAGADLRKELPGRLHVRLVEKQAVALLRLPAPAVESQPQLYYLDAEGRRIAPFDPRRDARPAEDGELVLVTSDHPERALKPALELRDEVAAAGAGWGEHLAEIEVLGDEDFRLWSADLAFPLLVRSGTLAVKNGTFEALLPEIARRYDGVAAVDLRFARRIIVQPFARRAAAGVPERGVGG